MYCFNSSYILYIFNLREKCVCMCVCACACVLTRSVYVPSASMTKSRCWCSAFHGSSKCGRWTSLPSAGHAGPWSSRPQLLLFANVYLSFVAAKSRCFRPTPRRNGAGVYWAGSGAVQGEGRDLIPTGQIVYLIDYFYWEIDLAICIFVLLHQTHFLYI